MLTISKIKYWANRVPVNVKALISTHLKQINFDYMTLDEDTHVYTSSKDPSVVWTSVTTLIEQYEPLVDWDAKANEYAKKHNMQSHVVKEMWDYNKNIAASTGSTCHLFAEFICDIMIDAILNKPLEDDIEAFKLVFPFQLLHNETFIPTMIGQEHVIEFWENVINEGVRWPVSAECIVPDIETKVCGTIDLIMMESDFSLSMWDYKTSKKLDNPYARSKKEYLLNEYASLINEPLSKYTIQLAWYKNMLRKHNIQINSTSIIHIPNTEGSELSIVPVNTTKVFV